MKEPKAVPQGVDYIMAVQCAGLAMALDVVWPRIPRSELGAAYSNWANDLAALQGRDWPTVMRDIEASRQDFLRVAGGGRLIDRGIRLLDAHGSSHEVCKVLADMPEDMIVGG